MFLRAFHIASDDTGRKATVKQMIPRLIVWNHLRMLVQFIGFRVVLDKLDDSVAGIGVNWVFPGISFIERAFQVWMGLDTRDFFLDVGIFESIIDGRSVKLVRYINQGN